MCKITDAEVVFNAIKESNGGLIETDLLGHETIMLAMKEYGNMIVGQSQGLQWVKASDKTPGKGEVGVYNAQYVHNRNRLLVYFDGESFFDYPATQKQKVKYDIFWLKEGGKNDSESIDFAEWIADEEYTNVGEGLWVRFCGTNHRGPQLTTKELYDTFKDSVA